VWLRGEHDVATVATLTVEIARAIALDDAGVVVDLSGAQFLGAATVGVLVRAWEFLRVQSRSFVLRDPTPSVRRLLELCGLADAFDIPHRDPTRVMGGDGALGSWVAVAATRPVARRPTVPEPPISDRDGAGSGAGTAPPVDGDVLGAGQARDVSQRGP
jgi:anti-anti-sigma factor